MAIYADEPDDEDEDLLAVEDLVRMFEEAEESSETARQHAERDRQYFDGEQLTEEELAALKKRGQPPVIDNRIKSKVDYLVGLEKTQRISPKALPRTPVHEQDAAAATQALRYVTDYEDYDKKRSGVWRNLLVEGAGGFSISVEPEKYRQSRVQIRQPPMGLPPPPMGLPPPPMPGPPPPMPPPQATPQPPGMAPGMAPPALAGGVLPPGMPPPGGLPPGMAGMPPPGMPPGPMPLGLGAPPPMPPPPPAGFGGSPAGMAGMPPGQEPPGGMPGLPPEMAAGLPPPGPGMPPPMPGPQAGAAPPPPPPTTAPPPPEQEFCVKIRRIAWDRMFYDPHSCETDYSDASYLGVVVWWNYADALAHYGDDVRDILDSTMLSTANMDTYDDKPKFNQWADRKRKRVRIAQIWVKRDDKWYFAEFTKSGILKSGPSPYQTDKGESDCELLFQSAYVNRDNDRYGLVREMISLQDEVNKRRSKALHLLNTAQIVMQEGSLSSLNDVEKVRREASRPDGVIVLAPSTGAIDEKFQFNARTDLAEGQFKLLQDSKNSIDLKGPNATMMGDKAGGVSSASGKAIIASQQGGMMEIGDLMDGLRDLDRRVFRAIWNRIRQFWTGEKWIRVTDDEKNIKWVGLNVDPARVEQAVAGNPEAAKKISGAVGNVAELDCDIIIDEAPDSLTPQLEQFEALAALKQYDAKGELPFRAIVQAAPNLKDKDKILELMDKAAAPPTPEAAQEAQQTKQIQLRGAMAEVSQKEADAQLKMAQAQKTQREAMAPPEQPAGPVQEPPDPVVQHKVMTEHQKALNEAERGRAEMSLKEQQSLIDADKATAEIRNKEADTDLKRVNADKIAAEIAEIEQRICMAPAEMAAKNAANGAGPEGEPKADPMAEMMAMMKKLSAPKRARKQPDGSWIAERIGPNGEAEQIERARKQPDGSWQTEPIEPVEPIDEMAMMEQEAGMPPAGPVP